MWNKAHTLDKVRNDPNTTESERRMSDRQRPDPQFHRYVQYILRSDQYLVEVDLISLVTKASNGNRMFLFWSNDKRYSKSTSICIPFEVSLR